MDQKIKQAIWDEKMDTERASRYYHKIVQLYSKESKLYLFLLLIGSSSALITLSEIFPILAENQIIYSRFISLAITLISIIGIVRSPGSKIITATTISNNLDDKIKDVNYLWENTDNLTDEDANKRLDNIREETTYITNAGKEIGVYKILNNLSMKEIHNVYEPRQ